MKHHTSRQIHLKSRPDGVPRNDDFQLAEVAISDPGKDEFLVRNEWLSVDPYMRGRMNESKSYVEPFRLGAPMEGGCVGRVVASRNGAFAEGDYVLGNQGWRDLWLSNGEEVMKIHDKVASPQSYLSVLGLTGMTAYVGLMKIAELKDEEQVFVSAASGAVGSIVCQIAKLHRCRVVGSSGSAKKMEWLKTKAGIDDAFNYHETGDVSTTLGELFPTGIDVYFDNVGGDHLEGALDHMNDFGRIACCGMISGITASRLRPPDHLTCSRSSVNASVCRVSLSGTTGISEMNFSSK